MKRAVFLFDVTGIMAQPWLEAGYECWIVDIQHPPAYETGGVTDSPRGKSGTFSESLGLLHKVHHDLSRPWLPPFPRESIEFVFAFPPCDHLAVSGARWFKGKGLRRLARSVDLFATAAEFCEWSGAPYAIENPVSTISTYWRKCDHWFHPHHYTGWCLDDNYTKYTCLWTGGGFVMPAPLVEPGLPKPDDRIHKAPPGPERHNFRSATPMGFARAVFAANHQPERLAA